MNTICTYIAPYIIGIATSALDRFVAWACSSDPRARIALTKAVNDYLTQKNLSLYILKSETEESRKIKYAEKVNKVTKSCIIAEIKLINKTLKQCNQQKSLIEYNKKDSIEDLVFKFAKKYHKNLNNNEFKKNYNKLAALEQTTDASFTTNNNVINDDDEAFFNGHLCWQAACLILLTRFECEKDHNSFSKPKSKSKFKTNEDNIIVDGIDLFINKAIKELKVKIDKNFSLFKNLLDPSISLESKIKNENINFDSSLERIMTNRIKAGLLTITLESRTLNVSRCAFKLQKLLECLREIKNKPQTISNLRLLYQTLTNCYSYFQENQEFMERYKDQGLPFGDAFFETKKFLLDLTNELHGPLEEAILNTKKKIFTSQSSTTKKSELKINRENIPLKKIHSQKIKLPKNLN